MRFTNYMQMAAFFVLLYNQISLGQNRIEKDSSKTLAFAVQAGAEKKEVIKSGNWISEMAEQSINSKSVYQDSNTFSKTYFSLYAPFEKNDFLLRRKNKKMRGMLSFNEDPIRYVEDQLISGNELMETFVNERATRLNLDSDYMIKGRITVRDLRVFDFIPTVYFNLPETAVQIEFKRKF